MQKRVQMKLNDILVEVGDPMAAPDVGDYRAKPFQDDSITRQLLTLRQAVVSHLRADSETNNMFQSAPNMQEAIKRLFSIIGKLPDAKGMPSQVIQMAAEQVAHDYWQK